MKGLLFIVLSLLLIVQGRTQTTQGNTATQPLTSDIDAIVKNAASANYKYFNVDAQLMGFILENVYPTSYATFAAIAAMRLPKDEASAYHMGRLRRYGRRNTPTSHTESVFQASRGNYD